MFHNGFEIFLKYPTILLQNFNWFSAHYSHNHNNNNNNYNSSVTNIFYTHKLHTNFIILLLLLSSIQVWLFLIPHGPC